VAAIGAAARRLATQVPRGESAAQRE